MGEKLLDYLVGKTSAESPEAKPALLPAISPAEKDNTYKSEILLLILHETAPKKKHLMKYSNSTQHYLQT